MTKDKQLTGKGDTLEEARASIADRVPDGMSVISEKIVSDGKPSVLKGVGVTVYAALQDVITKKPANSDVVEKRTLSEPKTKTVLIDSFDEASAKQQAQRDLSPNASWIEDVRLKISGRRGFLGIGKKAHTYEVRIGEPACVEVTVKPKAVVQAVVGLPKASQEEIEKFIGASKDGDTDIIHALFEKRSADSLVKARDRNMFTALHLASHKGHKGIVDLLLDGAANLNAISKSGFAPLHYAVDQGHDVVAETLLARGADVNLKEQGYGSTPLHYAAVRGNRKIAELLLTHGANPNVRDNTHLTPAELAAKEGQKDMADFLRKTKTDQPSSDLPQRLEEIKRKWKAKALQWWDSCGRESCYCDDNGCLVDGENGMYSKRLRHGGGYIPLNSTRIYCEECADQRLRRM